MKNKIFLILIVLSINANAQKAGETFELELNLTNQGNPITTIDSIVFEFKSKYYSRYISHSSLSSKEGNYKFKLSPEVRKITKKGKLKYYYTYYSIIKSGFNQINGAILLKKNKNIYIYMEKIISYPVLFRKYPEYPGGITNLRRFIYDSFNIDDLEKLDKEVCEIIFDLEESGKINNIEILNRSINTELKKEMINTFESMPNWIPAIVKGKPIPAKASIEIEFPLVSEHKINYKR